MADAPLYLIVCGGRRFGFREFASSRTGWRRHEPEAAFVGDRLLELMPALVLTGGCRSGADMLAAEWCNTMAAPLIEVPAPWRGGGKAAGPRRNRWLLDIARSLAKERGADLMCLAFPGGRGTADMVARCKAAGIGVLPFGVAESGAACHTPSQPTSGS